MAIPSPVSSSSVAAQMVLIPCGHELYREEAITALATGSLCPLGQHPIEGIRLSDKFSKSSPSVEDVVSFYLTLLGRKEDGIDLAAIKALENQIESLMQSDSTRLSNDQSEFYRWAQKLFLSGKVSDFVQRKLIEMGENKNVGVRKAPHVPSSSSISITLDFVPFGATEWKKYHGDPGVEPPLPEDIVTILQAPCPVWSGKKVAETHFLTLVPATVDGQPFTLKTLGRMAVSPLQGSSVPAFGKLDGDFKEKVAHQRRPNSYWILGTKIVLPRSNSTVQRSVGLSAKLKMIEDLKQKTGSPYQLPTVLEAATGFLMEYCRNPKFYGDDDFLSTFCQERNANDWIGWVQLRPGGECDVGFVPNYNSNGVIAIRRL